ncbi:MAG: serine hydrolase, partial [Bacteroidales bacterium]
MADGGHEVNLLIWIKRMRVLVLIIGLLSFIFRSNSQNVDLELQNILTNRRLMGLSTLAVCNDSIIYLGNVGTADYTRNIPVTDSTLYRIASISKTVTATALMTLYDQGLFSLDDDIGNILGYTVRNPNYPAIAITPRMLLSHTSSLQDGSGYSNFISDTYLKNHPPALSGLLSDTGLYYTCDLWQDRAPGTYFSYSNLNFGIIGTLIEKLSGQRFDIFCKQHILDPLGIKGSYRIQDISDINNTAVLYRMKNGEWQAQADNFQGIMPQSRDLSAYTAGNNGLIYSPQSGLRISAYDLSKIMLMYINGGIYKGIRILKDSIVSLMFRPQWIYNGLNGDNFYGLFRRWGLGFQLTTNASDGDIVVPNCEMTGHIGDSYGLISDLFFNKNNKFGMVFITNGSAGDFECGNYSAFNAVEEDIFRALFNLTIKPCMLSSSFDNVITGVNPDIVNDHFNARFYLPYAGTVNCKVYNHIGKEVSTYSWVFDSSGGKQLTVKTKGLGNGIYFCVF